MGARSTGSIARGGKVKKKSRFSPHEKVERARIGAGIKRKERKFRKDTGVNPTVSRDMTSFAGRKELGRARKRWRPGQARRPGGSRRDRLAFKRAEKAGAAFNRSLHRK